MSARRLRVKLGFLAFVAVAVGGIGSAQASTVRHNHAADRPIAGDTPSAVTQSKAQSAGRHKANAALRVNVGLTVRDSAGLDALIVAAGTPGSRQYGHYLTDAQYKEQYAPTDADVAAVRAWLKSQGIAVLGVSANNLVVRAKGGVRKLEKAFGVQINDYRYNGRAVYSNDRDPTVPGELNVNWVTGLNNFDVYKAYGSKLTGGGFDGGDLRSAYHVVGDGHGQTVGFTLWGRHIPQSDFDGYAAATGNTKLTIGAAGDDGLTYVDVDGSSSISNTDGEVAMDTQLAHGVAPGVHETYWLGKDNFNTTLEDVLNAAEASSVKVFSNSWGCDGCPMDPNFQNTLQAAAAKGQTFYFSSGDNGASVGRSTPAESQYVVAVGGTNLHLSGGNWSSETAWSDSGGGCDNGFARPSWQTGVGVAKVWQNGNCTGRAEPDVAALADPNTGVFIYYHGAGSCCWGGTSLSAPIWGAASVIWNKHNAATGRPGIGFADPVIYSVATDPTTYARDFHDITSGSNGFAAGANWDEVTGWGSPNFDNLFNNQADITYTGLTTATHNASITVSAKLLDHGASTPVVGRTISISIGADNCSSATNSSGIASCTLTVHSPPGSTSVTAAFSGDAAYIAKSVTNPFTVTGTPTKVLYTGPTSGDYNDPVTFTATLKEDNAGAAPVSNEPLTFTMGAESCTGTTNVGGVASCTVTPLDVPDPYTVHVSFAGDPPNYLASSTDAAFTVKKEESALSYTGPLTSHYHDAFTASARLTDPDGGAPIGGKTVTFTLGVGDSCSAVTDVSGNAACSITPHQASSQPLLASFAGDTFYASSTDSKVFSITPEETTMTYTGPTVILAGASGATLTAKLVEDGANDNDGDGGSPGPVPAETVTLSVGLQTCTGTTDPTGNVSCTIPSVSVPLGPETVGATFPGDASYQPSGDSKTATVFAFPSKGAFTLGNLTDAAAGTSKVTFWADQWWKLNSLSGGSAPASFKGFAATIGLPTTSPPTSCATNWTTGPGGSSAPPATIPDWMGVVVTKQVTKSGNTISGNSVGIVVVHVDPGYGPDPSQPGTGTIVATFC
jgi:Pro-kumamolisin, activation domain